MQSYLRKSAIVLALLGSAGLAVAQSGNQGKSDSMSPKATAPQGLNQGAKLELTAAQRSAIFQAVKQDKADVKAPPANFRASIGAQVPASIALYALPASALAKAPAAKPYKYTIAQNDVVLVDPTAMRVVDVIKR